MIKLAVLGLVQGLTEFLPVSSSGHLMIAQKLLGVNGEELVLQIVLHLATVCAVVIFLRREIARMFFDRKMLILVLVTTFVTGCVGLMFHRFFEDLFARPELLAPQMAFTGIVVLLTGFIRPGTRDVLGYRDAFVVGLAQALAIIPAVSRSGMTIASMLFMKVDRRMCFTFSFLISVPAILGAALLDAKDIGAAASGTGLGGLAAGFACSFAAGMFSLWLLRKLIMSSKFHYFGYYCLALAGVLYFIIK